MTEVSIHPKGHFLLFVVILILTGQIFVLFDISLADENNCATDCALLDKGWAVHSSKKFSLISREIIIKFRKNRNNYVHDTDGYISSPHSKKTFKYVTYDNEETPQLEMYGDIFFLTDPETGQLIELRWYDGRKRHVIYNCECQSCAFDIVPMVKNCLF